MQKVFVDTNIVIDFLGKRNPFFESSFDLFHKALKKKISIYVSAASYSTIYYILSDKISHDKLMAAFEELEKYISIVDVNTQNIKDSVRSDFSDFEDAIQYYSALNEKDMKIIISRDRKGFKASKLPVMTASEFLKTLSVN